MNKRVKGMMLLEAVISAGLCLVLASIFLMQMIELNKGVMRLERKMSFLQSAREGRELLNKQKKSAITHNQVQTRKMTNQNEEKIESKNGEFEISVTFIGEK
ncbi:hypothetical protein SAMN02745116_02594 [Pilibacter termitis]|uniref:Uncharacterized protein n=1 Tax=Pilibacter termitis TaxID=263852 RepID=A0A1T4RGZ2_9ENTE|nr:hypothetical protein [Pilibacter termitis]SKA15076.1 hypothetical protein SAMN02745116_02594 [Pilibacter termitis]